MVHGDGELVEPGDNLGTDCFNSSHDDSWTGHENAEDEKKTVLYIRISVLLREAQSTICGPFFPGSLNWHGFLPLLGFFKEIMCLGALSDGEKRGGQADVMNDKLPSFDNSQASSIH